MELNSQAIKKMSLEKIYHIILPKIERILKYYEFLSLTPEEIKKIIFEEIKETQILYDDSRPYLMYIQERIASRLEIITMSRVITSNDFELFNNYINSLYGIPNNYNSAINNLKRLSKLFNQYHLLDKEELITKLISQNPIINTTLKLVVSINMKEIIKNNFANISNEDATIALIRIYCELNNIKIFEESTDKFSNQLPDKEIDDKSTEAEDESIESIIIKRMKSGELDEFIKVNLTKREAQIIRLRYGLGIAKEKTLAEISSMLGITRENVSQIEAKALKKLTKKYQRKSEQVGIGVSVSSNKDEKGNQNSQSTNKGAKKMREHKTIYELLSQYTKEEIDEAISELSPEYRNVIKIKYGDDLDHPVVTAAYTPEVGKYFNTHVNPKIKRIIENKRSGGKYAKKQSTSAIEAKSTTDTLQATKAKQSSPAIKNISTNQTETIENNQDKPTPAIPSVTTTIKLNEPSTTISQNNELPKPVEKISMEDYLKMLEQIHTPIFMQMVSSLGQKDAFIIQATCLGIEGKFFSVTATANFLEITESEVITTITSYLEQYKKAINQSISTAIEVVSGKRKILVPKPIVDKYQESEEQ